MVFPFAVTFKRTLRGLVTTEKQPEVLQYIKKTIAERSADNIVVWENTISCKGSTSGWRGALFGVVDGGTFSLTDIDGKSYLIYEIRMRTLFITTGLMSAFVAIFIQIWWVGFIGFLWLCGMNWIIYVIRHGTLASEISSGLSDLVFGKLQEEVIDKEENNIDKEKLKSCM